MDPPQDKNKRDRETRQSTSRRDLVPTACLMGLAVKKATCWTEFPDKISGNIISDEIFRKVRYALSVTSLIRWFDNILALDDRSLALVIQICWAIWLARNNFLFNGNKINVHATVSRAFVGCSDFLDAIYSQGHPPISHSGEGCNVHKWQLPQMGRWKFNCDGAFCPKSKIAAFSIVVRDSVGRLISTNYGRIKVSSALVAEAWAIRVACAMVKSWGISAIIESDAKRAIQLCLNREGDRCKDIQTIIDDSLYFISGCTVPTALDCPSRTVATAIRQRLYNHNKRLHLSFHFSKLPAAPSWATKHKTADEVDMASASSNAKSGWPSKVCSCGAGTCIPTMAGPNAKNPSRYYYTCPVGFVSLSTRLLLVPTGHS
ncbi:hypothetical protein Vadar_007571 [Vaccinium darrowii]|uniref:Uncharacterized protein n=1 Tax=Vaccinium darrowii TaxID=229202 RepID=A0ACB7ZC82_9ERIC|nr:hypothetical protein Vadar_007571 [Vaccinium darrowii]